MESRCEQGFEKRRDVVVGVVRMSRCKTGASVAVAPRAAAAPHGLAELDRAECHWYGSNVARGDVRRVSMARLGLDRATWWISRAVYIYCWWQGKARSSALID